MRPKPGRWLRWLDLAVPAWLLLVVTAYYLVWAAPSERPLDPVPGLGAADGAAPCLLAAILAAGIIRYSALRFERRPAIRIAAKPGEPGTR